MTHSSAEATLKRELAHEQAHVDLVYEQLALATKSAQQVARQGRSLYESDRETWVRDEDGTALFERDAFAFQAARRLAILDAEHEGLVFGRLDQLDREVRYIGRIGVRDADFEPLVIDWRAPAAEPFYRATPTEPMSVVRRRVLRCRNDKVVGIEDDLLDTSAQRDDLPIIGEGALMAALTRARGSRMRDIVATIQSEQDEAIRAPYQGVTIISGGPGTGKTVVALHRAAYLLYSNRRRFERGGILVVGPSSIFMNYIERVLPSLGEESVTLSPIGDVVSDVLDVSAEREDTPAELAIKGSLRMVALLKRLIALPLAAVGSGGRSLLVTIKGEVLRVTEQDAARIRSDVLSHHKANQARDAAESLLQTALLRQVPEELGLDEDTARDLIISSAAYQMFLNAWWPTLDAASVLHRLADPSVVEQVSNGTFTPQEREVLAASYAKPGWSVADGALLDELVAMIGLAPDDAEVEPDVFLTAGSDVSELVTTADLLTHRPERDLHAEPHRTYAHMLIDEAQDISPMQWRMLRRRGSQASWTVVGDPAQSSWPSPEESERAMRDLIGSAPSRTFRLSTNYRSPAEVFSLAAEVVHAAFPDADIPHAIRSTGVEPRFLSANEGRLVPLLVTTLRDLAEQVDGTLSVIAPSSRLESLRSGLLADDRTTGLADRLSILSPLAAKGLEYDAAIVVCPDEIVSQTSGGVRALYVALTRPTQRLVTIDLAGSSPGWRGSRT